MKKLDNNVIAAIVIYLLCFAIVSFYMYQHWDLVSDPEKVQGFVESFGVYAPLALMVAQGVEVVFPYIPGPVLSIAGGYIFGVWKGTLFNLIANTIGSLIAFFIAKKLGRPVVERMFTRKQLLKYDKFFDKYSLVIIFLCRTQVFMPNDFISYASGLVKHLNWKKYTIATFLGYIPQFLLLNSVGAELQTGLFTIRMLWYLILAAAAALIYFFWDKIYKFIKG